MLDISRIAGFELATDPFPHAVIDGLFSPADAEALASTYPRDHYKTVHNKGGEKDYDYEARALVTMGSGAIAWPEELSPSWRELAQDLASPAYREAMSRLTGLDLMEVPCEVNLYHYGPGSSLGAHRDLPEKLVTHVLYFNRRWDVADGGCLDILRSKDNADVHRTVPPVIGTSAVIVRGESSWHAVRRVVDGCRSSRRSMNVMFHRPGVSSSMWPPGETPELHTYVAPEDREEPGLLSRLGRKLGLGG